MDKTRTQILEDIRIQMAEYVQLRGRLGEPMTFQQALLSHREQCRQNLADDPHGPWHERLGWLDQLCVEEGIA